MTAVLQNGSARLESKRGFWGAAGSQRFPFYPEKRVVKLACHSAQFFSLLLQIKEEAKIQNKQTDHANPLRRKQGDVLEDQGI